MSHSILSFLNERLPFIIAIRKKSTQENPVKYSPALINAGEALTP